MATQTFIQELEALGFSPKALPNNSHLVYFQFEIPLGKNKGKVLNIGFEIPRDYPLKCPGGPHFESRNIAGWIEPRNNIHDSPFKGSWRYWSRPFPDWSKGERSLKRYLGHIKNLLMKL